MLSLTDDVSEAVEHHPPCHVLSLGTRSILPESSRMRALTIGLVMVLGAVTPAAGPRRGRPTTTSRSRLSSATGWAASSRPTTATTEDVNLDDAASFGLIINAPAESYTTYTEWELYYSRQSAGIDRAPAGVDPSLDIEITHFLLGGTYVFEGELVRPFLSAGIGAGAPQSGRSPATTPTPSLPSASAPARNSSRRAASGCGSKVACSAPSSTATAPSSARRDPRARPAPFARTATCSGSGKYSRASPPGSERLRRSRRGGSG